MEIKIACNGILTQLSNLIDQISEQDFSTPVQVLNGSTIGQHFRHTLEFFFCLMQGTDTGIINYDKRAHDKLIETDKFFAQAALTKIKEFVMTQMENQHLNLEVGYEIDNEQTIVVETNLYRELIYNIEHAVHHMAIMKIGIREAASYVKLPREFGIASSTIRYQESIAAR